MKHIRIFFKRNWLYFLGIGVGALGGYLYWRFIGCTTGSCPITSSPGMSTVWGAILGALIFDLFVPKDKAGEKKRE